MPIPVSGLAPSNPYLRAITGLTDDERRGITAEEAEKVASFVAHVFSAMSTPQSGGGSAVLLSFGRLHSGAEYIFSNHYPPGTASDEADLGPWYLVHPPSEGTGWIKMSHEKARGVFQIFKEKLSDFRLQERNPAWRCSIATPEEGSGLIEQNVILTNYPSYEEIVAPLVSP